ncbi:MAG: LLM class flavin-dependent oxidoreductase [Pseudomonadales bacterium]|nr:LLM class flavin-dependent oxidoreductase [Pseudomonadales bacterium]
MKLGTTPWNFADRSAGGLAAQAVRAEALGFDSFWLPENHFNPHAIPDPLMLLAAVASSTRHIRLATTSYLLPLRNPLQAAEQVAVLDQLCNGRVILGIGRGYAPSMLKAFEVLPAEKRERFEHCLGVMRQAWSGQPVVISEAGDQVVVDPLPVQRPHPPLWVAAFGPKALAQAGRLGLPYLASPVETLQQLEANYSRHTLAASEAGHPRIDTVPIMRAVFVVTRSSQARRLRETVHSEALKSGRLPADAEIDDWTIIGDERFLEDRLVEYRERLGVSHLVVSRMRMGEMDAQDIEHSMARVADIAGKISGD